MRTKGNQQRRAALIADFKGMYGEPQGEHRNQQPKVEHLDQVIREMDRVGAENLAELFTCLEQHDPERSYMMRQALFGAFYG
jgi:hypothetical protein